MLRSNRTLAATIPLHCCDIAFHASSDVLQLLSASRCWPAGTTSYAEQASELLSFHSFCLIATFHCWLESTFGVHREDLHHISCSICPPNSPHWWLRTSRRRKIFRRSHAHSSAASEAFHTKPRKTSRMEQIVGALHKSNSIQPLLQLVEMPALRARKQLAAYPVTFERATVERPVQRN